MEFVIKNELALNEEMGRSLFFHKPLCRFQRNVTFVTTSDFGAMHFTSLLGSFVILLGIL